MASIALASARVVVGTWPRTAELLDAFRQEASAMSVREVLDAARLALLEPCVHAVGSTQGVT